MLNNGSFIELIDTIKDMRYKSDVLIKEKEQVTQVEIFLDDSTYDSLQEKEDTINKWLIRASIELNGFIVNDIKNINGNTVIIYSFMV